MKKQDLKPSRSSPGAFPASLSPPQENRKALRMNATYGRRCAGLLQNLSPVSCLGKMLLASSIWGSTKRSYAPCLRQGNRKGRPKPGCVPVGQWDFPQEEQKRGNLEPAPVGCGVLPDAGSLGRVPLYPETICLRPEKEEREPGSPGDLPGKSPLGQGGLKPGLGGMAYGLPERMDGAVLWDREPEGVPRITEQTKDRALRLKTLGNAVCPPQAYPIFHFMAEILTGRCKEHCIWEVMEHETV